MTVPIVIVGTGNSLLSDDGVGPRAIRALGERFELPAEVRLVDGGTAGLGLVAELSDADRILILDAVRTGRQPGTVLTLAGQALRNAPRGLFPHEVGVADLTATLRLAGRDPEVVLIGIEPARVEVGLELSAPVAASFEALLEAALRQLHDWGVKM